MSKGDHVFNNVVAKLMGAFEAGFIAYARKKDASGALKNAQQLIHSRSERDDWMRRHMTRTWALLTDFREGVAFKVTREELQTSTYQGLDINNDAYSENAQDFERAVVLLFNKIATTRSYVDENELAPDINRLRRAFFHMTNSAEDTGAAHRLLEEHKGNPREQARIQMAMDEVRGNLEWSWARCERIFRMAVNELLRMPR